MRTTPVHSGRRRPLMALSAALAWLLLAGCPNGGGGSDDISGTYVAQNPDGTMTLQFKSGHKVTVTMQDKGGQPEAKEADYLIDGNNITIQVPGGMPLQLVRSGKALDANMMGYMLHFTKK